MDIERMFEDGAREGLFTDFDVCVRGPVEVDFRGGRFVSDGARLFDVASLTKALTHLVLWKLFSNKKLSPDDLFSGFISVPNVGDRRIWHFMSYVVQNYRRDLKELRDVLHKADGSVFGELIGSGFGSWTKRFSYDNYSSAYLGFLLESMFGTDIEGVIHSQLLMNSSERDSLLFNPVARGLVEPEIVVPTSNSRWRGIVHDPLSAAHITEKISVAGVFSTAHTLANVFHRTVDEVIASGFYDAASQNQLVGAGIEDHEYGLGFDIPYAQSLETSVEGPLVFAGYTGCRLFFAKRPRVTICFVTNRVFLGDSEDSRKNLTRFSWKVIREVLRQS
jgi:CubicO group peptidase (beta-lactamase class C family)